MLKLYDFPESPYCQKTRIVLAEKDLSFEIVPVDLLRRRVVGRAHPLAGRGERPARAVAPRQAEVGQVHVRPLRKRARDDFSNSALK